MKIKIRPQQIREAIPSEDELLDMPSMESIYVIRKLQLAVYYGDSTVVEVEKVNSSGQVFIDEFDIWINKDEYAEQK